MMLSRPTIMDARGRRVPLVAHEMLLPGLSDRERRERLQRVGWQGGPPTLGPRAPLVVALLVITTLVLALGPMVLAQRLSAPMWLQLSLGVLPAVVSSFGGIFWTRRLVPSNIGDAYLRAGFCASCGYDLADASADAEAITLCPECGAAWHLPEASSR